MSDVRKLHEDAYRQISWDENNDAEASCYVKSAADGKWRRVVREGRMIDGQFVPDAAPKVVAPIMVHPSILTWTDARSMGWAARDAGASLHLERLCQSLALEPAPLPLPIIGDLPAQHPQPVERQ